MPSAIAPYRGRLRSHAIALVKRYDARPRSSTEFNSTQVLVAIELFPANSVGCPVGIKRIYGPDTGLTDLEGMAFGPKGHLFAITSGGIEVFAPGSVGDVRPTRVIFGPHTHLVDLSFGIAVDAAGFTYVTTQQVTSSILVFRPNAHGDSTPVRRIVGPATQLYDPFGIAVSSDGRIFVDNTSSRAITVYGPGANGDAAPIQSIAGPATGIGGIYITVSR